MMKPVVFDLDGTLADCSHRLRWITGPVKNWDNFYREAIHDQPIDTARHVYWGIWRQRLPIEVWTGRPDRFRAMTHNWLQRYGLPHRALRMRLDADLRPDHELKESWLLSLPEYERPMLVFEDRQRVVDMYWSHGVSCYQVAEGDY